LLLLLERFLLLPLGLFVVVVLVVVAMATARRIEAWPRLGGGERGGLARGVLGPVAASSCKRYLL
jgi:hypothetical protein